jgi:hypothetical protein
MFVINNNNSYQKSPCKNNSVKNTINGVNVASNSTSSGYSSQSFSEYDHHNSIIRKQQQQQQKLYNKPYPIWHTSSNNYKNQKTTISKQNSNKNELETMNNNADENDNDDNIQNYSSPSSCSFIRTSTPTFQYSHHQQSQQPVAPLTPKHNKNSEKMIPQQTHSASVSSSAFTFINKDDQRINHFQIDDKNNNKNRNVHPHKQQSVITKKTKNIQTTTKKSSPNIFRVVINFFLSFLSYFKCIGKETMQDGFNTDNKKLENVNCNKTRSEYPTKPEHLRSIRVFTCVSPEFYKKPSISTKLDNDENHQNEDSKKNLAVISILHSDSLSPSYSSFVKRKHLRNSSLHRHNSYSHSNSQQHQPLHPLSSTPKEIEDDSIELALQISSNSTSTISNFGEKRRSRKMSLKKSQQQAFSFNSLTNPHKQHATTETIYDNLNKANHLSIKNENENDQTTTLKTRKPIVVKYSGSCISSYQQLIKNNKKSIDNNTIEELNRLSRGPPVRTNSEKILSYKSEDITELKENPYHGHFKNTKKELYPGFSKDILAQTLKRGNYINNNTNKIKSITTLNPAQQFETCLIDINNKRDGITTSNHSLYKLTNKRPKQQQQQQQQQRHQSTATIRSIVSLVGKTTTTSPPSPLIVAVRSDSHHYNTPSSMTSLSSYSNLNNKNKQKRIISNSEHVIYDNNSKSKQSSTYDINSNLNSNSASSSSLSVDDENNKFDNNQTNDSSSSLVISSSSRTVSSISNENDPSSLFAISRNLNGTDTVSSYATQTIPKRNLNFSSTAKNKQGSIITNFDNIKNINDTPSRVAILCPSNIKMDNNNYNTNYYLSLINLRQAQLCSTLNNKQKSTNKNKIDNQTSRNPDYINRPLNHFYNNSLKKDIQPIKSDVSRRAETKKTQTPSCRWNEIERTKRRTNSFSTSAFRSTCKSLGDNSLVTVYDDYLCDREVASYFDNKSLFFNCSNEKHFIKKKSKNELLLNKNKKTGNNNSFTNNNTDDLQSSLNFNSSSTESGSEISSGGTTSIPNSYGDYATNSMLTKNKLKIIGDGVIRQTREESYC